MTHQLYYVITIPSKTHNTFKINARFYNVQCFEVYSKQQFNTSFILVYIFTSYRIVREPAGTSVALNKKVGKTLLTEQEKAACWIGHFNEVLNQPMPDDLFNFTREEDVRSINATRNTS